MNVLFLTISDIKLEKAPGIYGDLLRKFVQKGHNVYAVSAAQRRQHEKTHVRQDYACSILRVKTLNIQKTNILEKGIATVLIESLFIKAIKKYYSNIRFDLVLYATPPVTFAKVVQYVKKRDNAKSYLLLKDIFPQNAVDIGIMSQRGVKGILYRYFRKKEKKLYALSDKIGCMSQANCDYILKHNLEISSDKVEICPNCVEYRDFRLPEAERIAMRERYGIPLDKKVFVYGGNLGKPQGISFLIECLKSQAGKEDVFFLIVGDGTEYGKLQDYVEQHKPNYVRVMKRLPKEDYDRMIAACDVGLIFLDHRFTIPNFPSRLLAYMQAGLPVLACTDANTDIGKVIVEGGFGWWCESNDVKKFNECVITALTDDKEQLSKNAIAYLQQHYLTENAYQTIIRIV